jgi:signal transduction histidine kinase
VFLLTAQYMDRQTKETIEAEIQGLREQYQLHNLAGLKKIVEHRSSSDPDRLGVYLLADLAGRPITGNLPHWPDVTPQDDNTLRFTHLERRENGEVVGRPVVARAFVLRRSDGRLEGQLLVGRDIRDKIRTTVRLRNAILWGGAVMFVVGLGGGYVMSRYTLTKLETVNRTTAAIIAGNLGERIAVDGGGDEFDDLSENLNAMLERIERLLTGMREVTDNIAHDLRTPLNRLRARIEVALMRDLDLDEARELLDATVKDADALIETFNALLNIARAEAGAQQAEWEELDLAEIARDVFELYEPLAEERSMRLALEDSQPAMVMGNRQMIAQAIANLVDNAIKYGHEGGEVVLSTLRAPQPSIVVADNGPGIPTEMRHKALERFVRLDPDRSTPGNGLGLSLVSAVARLHDASLDLSDNAPGLRVTLAFKPAPAATLRAAA